MFEGEADAQERAGRVVEELADHALTKSHARHLPMSRCRELGLKVAALEEHPELQEAVLSVHHAFMVTLSSTPACKLIENHNGVAFIKMVPGVAVLQ